MCYLGALHLGGVLESAPGLLFYNCPEESHSKKAEWLLTSEKDAWVSREAQPGAYCDLIKGAPQLRTAAHGAGRLELL